jgi:hypothetical protein
VAHPELQFGPLAILVAAPFAALGRAGEVLAMVVFAALGLAIVGLVDGMVRRVAPDRWARVRTRDLVVGGVAFLVAWGDIAIRSLHVDDAIALAALVAAMWMLAGERPWVAAVALGVAAAAKPWAIGFAPVALVGSEPMRRRGARMAVVAWVAIAGWIPFVLDARRTLSSAAGFAERTDPRSTLRALGFHAVATPSWDRPVQLALGFAVAAWVVHRGRWAAAPAAAVAVRLAVDPVIRHYYTAGLVLVVLIAELVHGSRHGPWRAIVVWALLELPIGLRVPPFVVGELRLLAVAIVLVYAVRGPASPDLANGCGPPATLDAGDPRPAL